MQVCYLSLIKKKSLPYRQKKINQTFMRRESRGNRRSIRKESYLCQNGLNPNYVHKELQKREQFFKNYSKVLTSGCLLTQFK